MKKFPLLLMTVITLTFAVTERIAAQSVPQGIHYQAVARDNAGKEMSEKTIDVRFSIIPGNPLNTSEYEELHQAIRTSKYGVFTLIIGNGVKIGGTVNSMADIQWGQAAHFLKVEIKFENIFVDMGTMQFLSVPYALFAGKSLEPGPAGPAGPTGPQGTQGPPGDPASDNQKISFAGSILTISGNPGNWVDLTALINDADANPTNEIQDLELIGNALKITGNPAANPVNFAKYDQRLLWNSASRKLVITNSTDTIDLSRVLTFVPGTNMLSLNGGNSVDLTSLKNDADASVTNELISSVAMQGSELVITEAGTERRVDLSTNMIAFRAKKLVSTPASSLTEIAFIPGTVEENYGSAFNGSTGEFKVPITGIYTFFINFFADGSGGSRKLIIHKNNSLYEEIGIDLAAYTLTTRSITMRLTVDETIKLMINSGASTQTGTGTFSGYRVF